MLLNFLGRGSAFNIKEGNTSAFIKINNELILLDCGESIFERIIDEFYQDTCLADYEGSTHASLRLLCETIPEDKRYKVYCMHIDCDELIKKAKDAGFNVAKIKTD